MSADLVTWLREQIAEDERQCEFNDEPESWCDRAEGVHYDSRRVLAEVTAKRELLTIHRPAKFTDVSLGIIDADVCLTCHTRLDYPDAFTEEQADAWEYPLVQEQWPCRSVEALARPYTDRPGFDPSWLD